ncbi:hypothetical protein YC2023_093432 [Brassica napus]
MPRRIRHVNRYLRVATDTFEIESLLLPTTDEQHLVATVQELQIFHVILNRWKEVLMVEKRKTFWEDLYRSDQSNRVFPEPGVEPQPAVEAPQNSPLHQAEESPPQNSQEPIITGSGDQSQNNVDPENQEHDPSQSLNSGDLFNDWNEMNKSRSPSHEELTNVGGSGDTLIQQEHEDDESTGSQEEDMNEMNKENEEHPDKENKEEEREAEELRRSNRLRKSPNNYSPSLIKPSK